MDPGKEKNSQAFNRRDFIKLGAVATTVGATSLAAAQSQAIKALAEHNKSMETRAAEKAFEFDDTYKPFEQKNNIFMATLTGRLPALRKKMMGFHGPGDIDPETPGMHRLDYALKEGGYAGVEYMAPGTPASIPNTGVNTWKQRTQADKHHPFDYQYLFEDQYHFQDKEQATNALKKAAKLYGADLAGITPRNPKFDYAKFIDPLHKKEFGWEEFPFEPKSVIVLGFEMDYEAYTTAPTYVSEGATGDAYSRITKTTHQLAVFLRILGYKAVATCNDTGLNIPYAISAGLGEGSRMGLLITPEFGPRLRIGKVYTEFDFCNYDQPIQFGVVDFCQRCMKCADACPASAISRDKKPSFRPTHGNKNTFFNNKGVKKWHLDAEKCFGYWMEINAGCGACIAACPYNKPGYWHHRLVDRLTAASPGPVHDLMREMDDLFGYGNTHDGQAVKEFWKNKNSI